MALTTDDDQHRHLPFKAVEAGRVPDAGKMTGLHQAVSTRMAPAGSQLLHPFPIFPVSLLVFNH